MLGSVLFSCRFPGNTLDKVFSKRVQQTWQANLASQQSHTWTGKTWPKLSSGFRSWLRIGVPNPQWTLICLSIPSHLTPNGGAHWHWFGWLKFQSTGFGLPCWFFHNPWREKSSRCERVATGLFTLTIIFALRKEQKGTLAVRLHQTNWKEAVWTEVSRQVKAPCLSAKFTSLPHPL